ncbi:MAG: serine--tRNA ligase [Candidatus Pacebacteria bacterium]|jgi:seryl-tRNA synthetase|nr:serine--tRNA ligase [Candidatus Paceibacterota bacterium]MDP6659799.1 serine--tRNA ligase [Candidatus Paceibacterota bacterium]|tara:strand:+ start:8871 stop:10151 length:1281 start_codon:yes stop_codon:yes gene_type:complete
MLDIKFILGNKRIVEETIQNKKGEPVDLGKLESLYEERKKLRQKVTEINQKRNIAAKERNVDEGKKLRVELQKAEDELDRIEKEFVRLMIKIPNVASPDTPIGSDESHNKVVRQWGDKTKFNFKAKEHDELGKELGVIDSEKAADISGARFTYLKGDLAMIQYALFHFVMNVLTNEETLKEIANEAGADISVKPFVPVVPPLMMKTAVMNRMARLDPIDERYVFEKDDLVLIGSAEHTLGPLHMDEVIEDKNLPLRYVAFTPAFRREAGSYGKDTKGIIRQHQFDKIEMETFTRPEDSLKEQDFIVGIQEYIMRKLKIPYQVVIICTGDMGLPDYRQFDIEAWMPGQHKYRETHTSDLMNGYQARRLNTRIKKSDGKMEPVHMNDATALAMGRALAAIMENYQKEDGSIKVPDVLQKYVGKEVIES